MIETEQSKIERRERYREALQNALDKLAIDYGFTLRATILTEKHGELIQHKPILEAAPIDGWQPSESK